MVSAKDGLRSLVAQDSGKDLGILGTHLYIFPFDKRLILYLDIACANLLLGSNVAYFYMDEVETLEMSKAIHFPTSATANTRGILAAGAYPEASLHLYEKWTFLTLAKTKLLFRGRE
jgi:hypothetical protein